MFPERRPACRTEDSLAEEEFYPDSEQKKINKKLLKVSRLKQLRAIRKAKKI